MNYCSSKRFLLLIFMLFCFGEATLNASKLERLKYNNPDLIVDLGVGLWGWPLPVDYDSDGDFDLLISCTDTPYNGIYLFENTGLDKKFPVFAPAKRLSKGISNIQVSYVNNKPRILARNLEYVDFVNDSFAKKMKIYPVNNVHKSKGSIRANQWKYCDFDGDNDLDLIVGVGDWADYGWDNGFDKMGKWIRGPLHGYVYLIINNGTDFNPLYEEPKKIFADNKPIDVYGMPTPNINDFDGDGDFDIICGEFIDKFTYFENNGTRTSPKYAGGRYLEFEGDPIKMDLCMFVPVAIDWDRDGDIDLVVGQEDGRVALLENTGSVVGGIPEFRLPVFFRQKAKYVKVGALVTPFSVDWDADGDEDLICGNTAGRILFIENLGGGEYPKWASPKILFANGKEIRIMAGKNGSIQGPCEEKWGYTTLTVADWDGDGLNDIIVNSIWGKIVWFKNIGTKEKPQLAEQQDVVIDWQGQPQSPEWNWWTPDNDKLVTQWRTTPFVIDLNKDGMNDLVMLDYQGYLAYFQRVKKNGNLILRKPQRIFNIMIDGVKMPLKLSTGYAGGSGRRKIAMVDWDLDGKTDLLVNGKNILFYKNISLQEGQWLFEDRGLLDDRILAGHTSSPAIVDWNSDGIPDLLIGAEDGYLYYMKNSYNN